MGKYLLACVCAFAASRAQADIVYENDLIQTEEIFDLEFATLSSVVASTESSAPNTTQYYCVFRSKWSAANHPADFPELARWGNPLLYSHTEQYLPFQKDRSAPYGVEVLAETSFTDRFQSELEGAGILVGDVAEGTGFFVAPDERINYAYLPPVRVSAEHPYLSGIAGFAPSPDWFTGFYAFNTVKEVGMTFWDSFLIRTYPWDAGTDDGESYSGPDRDTFQPGVVTRIEAANSANSVFLAPSGDKVLPLAEWQCILHTCPTEDPDCQKENWPPSNECDVLRFPECDTVCEGAGCELCLSEKSSEPEGTVFRRDCCLAGRIPVGRRCEVTFGQRIPSTAPVVTEDIPTVVIPTVVLPPEPNVATEIPVTVDDTTGRIYESGTTQVNVTMQDLDNFGSNRKCAEFKSNAPERYDTACFTSIYTDGGTFFDCDVLFGDKSCEGCRPCSTQTEEVGYTIDCFTVQPEEDTDNQCILLSDKNIQAVLVDTVFEEEFDFLSTKVETSGPQSSEPTTQGVQAPASLPTAEVVVDVPQPGSIVVNEYQSGETTARTTFELTDSHGSNIKCVKFLDNGPKNYDTGCFISSYGENNEFSSCGVEFDTNACEQCNPCITNGGNVGYELQCMTVQPSEDTGGVCVELNNRNIQRVLADTRFNEDFVFSQTALSNDPTMVSESVTSTSVPALSRSWTVIVCSFCALMPWFM